MPRGLADRMNERNEYIKGPPKIKGREDRLYLLMETWQLHNVRGRCGMEYVYTYQCGHLCQIQSANFSLNYVDLTLPSLFCWYCVAIVKMILGSLQIWTYKNLLKN